jgi:hypothetical protein
VHLSGRVAKWPRAVFPVYDFTNRPSRRCAPALGSLRWSNQLPLWARRFMPGRSGKAYALGWDQPRIQSAGLPSIGETCSQEVIAEFICTAARCFGRREKNPFPSWNRHQARFFCDSLDCWCGCQSPERIRIEWRPADRQVYSEAGR